MLFFSILIPTIVCSIQVWFYKKFLIAGELSARLRWGALTWGCIGAVTLCGLFFWAVDGLAESMYSDPQIKMVFEQVFLGPPVEEFTKGLFVLFAWLALGVRGRRALLVLGALSGVGFFFFESVGYLLGAKNSDEWSFQLGARVIVLGFKHSLYSSYFGLGLGFASVSGSKFLKVVYPVCGFAVATLIHGFANLIANAINAGHSQEGWQITEACYAMMLLTQVVLLFYARSRIRHRIRKIPTAQ